MPYHEAVLYLQYNPPVYLIREHRVPGTEVRGGIWNLLHLGFPFSYGKTAVTHPRCSPLDNTEIKAVSQVWMVPFSLSTYIWSSPPSAAF